MTHKEMTNNTTAGTESRGDNETALQFTIVTDSHSQPSEFHDDDDESYKATHSLSDLISFSARPRPPLPPPYIIPGLMITLRATLVVLL